MKLITRRALLRLGILGTTCGVAPYTYGTTHGRTGLVVEHCDCPLVPLTRSASANTAAPSLDRLTVAVMADFHFDETLDHELVATAVELCNSLEPDLVLLPGDFVSHDASAAKPLAEELGRLRSRLGVFATSGNHDHWSDIRRIQTALEHSGIEVLRNESRLLEHRSKTFAVVGLDSVWGGYPDYHKATRSLDLSIPRILSMHEPDYFDTLATLTKPQSSRPVLQVSGHTHGGQVCAPFIGPLLLPSWGKNYPAGRFGKPGANLYVTRGVGTIGPNARFFCRPEVSLLTLRY